MAEHEYAIGDVVNDHVLIGGEWVPVRKREAAEGETYNVGDVVNGHVWTGGEWVTVTARKALKGNKPGLRERMEAKAEDMTREADEKSRHADEKARRSTEKRQQDSMLDQCGRVVAEGSVANRQVKIYEKGYVRIGMFRLGEPERLLGITASDNSQQKTGLGRAVGATVTLGANLILSPNKRGSLYLIIVTDKKTHNLTSSPPTNSELKAMHKLEAAGRSVLATLEAQQRVDTRASTSAPSSAGPSLADQLTQLSQLHEVGALTEEEFAAAKARLLTGDA